MLAVAFLEGIGYTLMVIFGVGFLIFFHEMGHFLAAKAAGVRVDAFSLGFGPRIFGWRKGDTDYRLSLFPIGGYVKMTGEEPGEADASDPGALHNQTVGWRFLIFSGGVIMNLLFALIVFPLVFHEGVPFTAPLVGEVAPGSPAWRAGMEPGDRVMQVNGTSTYSFEQLQMEAALSGEEGVELEIRRKDGKKAFVSIHPEHDDRLGFKVIGIRPATAPEVRVQLTGEDGPAMKAGLRNGDILISFAGRAATRKAWDEWTIGERLPDPERWKKQYPEVPFVVSRDGKTKSLTLRPEFRVDEKNPKLGVFLFRTRIMGVRPGDALVDELGLRRGDILLELQTPSSSRLLLDDNDLRSALSGAQAGAELVVRRVAPKAEEMGTAPIVRVPIPDDLRGPQGAARFLHRVALGEDLLSGRVRVQKGQAAWRLGLRDGDQILKLDGKPYKSWPKFVKTVQEVKEKPVEIEWQTPGEGGVRRGQIRALPVTVPSLGFGLRFEYLREIYQSGGFLASLVAGGRHSIDTLRQLYVTLKRILGGSVSAENLGGIITISRVSYDRARSGLPRFLYFLAILSLNLAFINVLPIPVLDGGHLLFLGIEWIKGSPVSERVMGYAQMVGLVMVLALMIFVTFNDIVRLFR